MAFVTVNDSLAGIFPTIPPDRLCAFSSLIFKLVETFFVVYVPEYDSEQLQVIIDGFDVMSSVKDNKLTAKIRENSKMIVTFSKSSSDMNNDGNSDISDVVTLVNMILGQ